ncbi:MAG: hypothetical protein J7513_15080 [Solirubrobacteraceae bacterium]|nr:hypothetical protein [Solirubrobacteraceae bacterium]
MGPVEILVFLAWLGCAAAGWRIGTAKGVDAPLCAGASLALGPVFLVILWLLPNFDDYRPRLSRHDEAPRPSAPREPVYAKPPPARPNIDVESARRLAGLGGELDVAAAPRRAAR